MSVRCEEFLQALSSQMVESGEPARGWFFENSHGQLDSLGFGSDGSASFGEIGVVNPFAGSRIVGLSKFSPLTILAPRSREFVLVDSNLASAIRVFSRTGKSHVKGLLPFLEDVVANSRTLSPLCYLLENEELRGQTTRVDLEETARAILSVELCDSATFLRDGIFLPNLANVEAFLSRLSVRSIDEVVDFYLSDRYLALYRPLELFDAIFAVLAGAHRINMTRRSAAVEQRLEMLLSLVENEIGLFPGRAFLAAYLIFKNRLGRLLRCAPNTRWPVTRQRLIGATWDVWFAMLPEKIFAESVDDTAYAAVVASQDKGFLELSSILRLLYLEIDDAGRPKTYHNVVAKEADETVLNQIMMRVDMLSASRSEFPDGPALAAARQLQERLLSEFLPA